MALKVHTCARHRAPRPPRPARVAARHPRARPLAWHQGTKARYQVPASFEGGQMPLHMRLPKLKGFKKPAKVEFQVVNLAMLTKLYPRVARSRSLICAKGAVRKGYRSRSSATATSLCGLGECGCVLQDRS